MRYRKNFNTEEELTKHGQIEHSEKYQEQDTFSIGLPLEIDRKLELN
jgi:hypothetical protein